MNRPINLTPRRKYYPIRPKGLGFHMPRSRTGQPEWFRRMKEGE